MRVAGRLKQSNEIVADENGVVISTPGENLLKFVCNSLAYLRNKERKFANEVAEESGVSRVWLSSLENSRVKSKITLRTIQRVAEVIGYDMRISFEKSCDSKTRKEQK